MSQMSTSLQNIVAGNTSIKMAGGVSDKDARALAPDMRTNVDFLTNLKKSNQSAQFAAYVRNRTAQAVCIDVPFGLMQKEPRMSDTEHAQLIERNRERYSASPTIEPTPVRNTDTPNQPTTMAQPPHDISASPPTLPDDEAHTTPSKDY